MTRSLRGRALLLLLASSAACACVVTRVRGTLHSGRLDDTWYFPGASRFSEVESLLQNPKAARQVGTVSSFSDWLAPPRRIAARCTRYFEVALVEPLSKDSKHPNAALLGTIPYESVRVCMNGPYAIHQLMPLPQYVALKYGDKPLRAGDSEDPPKSKRLPLPPAFQVYYELSAAAWAAARTQIRASKKSVGVGATPAAVSGESCFVAAPALDLKEEWRHPEARLGYRKQPAPVKRVVVKGSDAHEKQKLFPNIRSALVEGARFAGDGARAGAAALRGLQERANSGNQQQVLQPAADSEQAQTSIHHNAAAVQHSSSDLVHPLTALARAHGVAADARRILAESDVALLEVAALARLRAAASGGDSDTTLLELATGAGDGSVFEAGSRSAGVAAIDADATARLGMVVVRPDYHARGTDPQFDVGAIDMHSEAIAPQLPDFLRDRLAAHLHAGVDTVVAVPLTHLANCLAYGTVSPYSLGDQQRRTCHPGTKGHSAGGAAALDSLAWEAAWSTHNGATRFVAGAPPVPAHGLPGGTAADEIAARVYQLDHEHPHLNLAPYLADYANAGVSLAVDHAPAAVCDDLMAALRRDGIYHPAVPSPTAAPPAPGAVYHEMDVFAHRMVQVRVLDPQPAAAPTFAYTVVVTATDRLRTVAANAAIPAGTQVVEVTDLGIDYHFSRRNNDFVPPVAPVVGPPPAVPAPVPAPVVQWSDKNGEDEVHGADTTAMANDDAFQWQSYAGLAAAAAGDWVPITVATAHCGTMYVRAGHMGTGPGDCAA